MAFNYSLDRVIGSIIVCASQNIGMLIVGRFINGFCVGICSAQVPVYISELAPPSKRGRLVGAQQWAITWGNFFSFFTLRPKTLCLMLTKATRHHDYVLHILWLLQN